MPKKPGIKAVLARMIANDAIRIAEIVQEHVPDADVRVDYLPGERSVHVAVRSGTGIHYYEIRVAERY